MNRKYRRFGFNRSYAAINFEYRWLQWFETAKRFAFPAAYFARDVFARLSRHEQVLHGCECDDRFVVGLARHRIIHTR